MPISPSCFQCAKRRYTKFADSYFGEYNQERRLAFYKECEEEVATAFGADIDAKWERVARKYAKTHDINEKEKEIYNKVVLSMKDDIEAMLDKSEDVLLDAVKYAIAGNIIDFATIPDLTLDALMEIIKDVQNIEFDEELFGTFMEELKAAKNVVLLLDNVGEVVLDALLCKKIKELYPEKHITVIPAGYPISSDTTAKEAYEAGMADYADIVPNGNDIAGTYLPLCSEACKNAIDEADILLSKGMANFETMSGSRYNVYYFFLCKCKFYCDALNAELMDPIFVSDRHSNIREKLRDTWNILGREEADYEYNK